MNLGQSYGGLSRVVDRLFPRVSTYEDGSNTKAVKTKPYVDPFDYSGFGHERSILRRLVGVHGVPQFFVSGESTYGIKHPAGKPLAEVKFLPSIYFKDLRDLVLAIHSRGVAGLNYENPNSVLVDAFGNPIVTDFSGAMVYENGRTVNTYPKMRHVFLEHLRGAVDRKARPDDTLVKELQLAKRAKNYFKMKIKNRRKKRFEEAKKMDYGFISSLKLQNMGESSVTQEELAEIFNFSKHRIQIT